MKKKKEKVENKVGITESFLGGIPILGDLFKELGKTETFKERFKEVDEKIKENLEKGEKKRWGFEANLSIRPIIQEIKKETSEISLHEDYFYGKKGDQLTLAVKVPQEKTSFRIEKGNLILEADNFKKEIELPGHFREIKRKSYQEGVLVLKLSK